MVTTVNLNRRSIHSAAFDTAIFSLEASRTSSCSLVEVMTSGPRENDAVLLEMKSDKSQKKVTVYSN